MTELKAYIDDLDLTIPGRLACKYFPYRKQVILANIDQVFGESLTSSEKQRLMAAFYSHFIRSVKEAIQLRFLPKKSLLKRVEVKGHEQVIELAELGKGVLVLTGHFGSFEFAPIVGMMKFEAFKGRLHFIRRKLKHAWLEKILFRRYYQAGLHVITKDNALEKVTSALDNNDAVVFVLDQHASLANRDGIAAEFFGKKAGTYRSLATFARYTEAPVVPASSYRRKDGTHVLEFHPPIAWQVHEKNHEALYLNTRAYNEALEKIILKHPEQWWWMHRRWKLKVE